MTMLYYYYYYYSQHLNPPRVRCCQYNLRVKPKRSLRCWTFNSSWVGLNPRHCGTKLRDVYQWTIILGFKDIDATLLHWKKLKTLYKNVPFVFTCWKAMLIKRQYILHCLGPSYLLAIWNIYNTMFIVCVSCVHIRAQHFSLNLYPYPNHQHRPMPSHAHPCYSIPQVEIIIKTMDSKAFKLSSMYCAHVFKICIMCITRLHQVLVGSDK